MGLPIYVTLRWLSAEEGGRKQVPIDNEYRGIARTGESEAGWMIRLLFLGAAKRAAEATFLSPEALRYLGPAFWLVEGSNKVAEVQVVVPLLKRATPSS